MNMSENQRALQRENSRLRMQRIRQGDILPLPTGTCFEEDQIPLHFCGQLDQVCPKCRAKYFELEQTTYSKTFHKCCSKGKVELEPIQTTELLESLMTGKHQLSKNFKENIRSVNSALAFASMGANLAPPPGYGPYCFRINGQIYHRSGALHPENDQRVFAQLYILDPDEAARQRMIISKNSGCNPDLMKLLSLYIAGINPFADACKMLHENADGEPPLERDLIIHCRSLPNERKTQRISILDPNLEPMVYPILFPYGDQSWTPNLKLSYNPSCVRNVQRAPAANPRTRITQMQYYEYRLSIRDEFNPLLSAGKLTQQYFVDAYVKLESNRLQYIRQNLKKMRTELYTGLMDYIQSEAAAQGVPLLPGKAVILPSSFQGSPRNMAQNYQDAMAIVRKHGKPDFFVTMTCNPKWLEIVENLKEGQSVENRPDLVVRVFKMKLDVLLEQIKRKDFLVKQLQVFIIDQFISAEIPDQETRPRLYEIVTRHMVHGPCGEHNLNSPCMVDGHCSKEFPKQFQEETLVNVSGYPRYKRRNNGVEAIVNGKYIDNSWIVPYCPMLSLRYNCHINVECCASVKSVKYLFKYVYKGHDCANISITEHATLNHDEIKSHMDSRYVSAPEAGWRLFSFPMHQQSHSIMRLQVHLPGQQSICFNEDNIEEVVQQAGNKDTTLTAWFKLNQVDENARNILYGDIPQHYVFDKRLRKWIPRQRGAVLIMQKLKRIKQMKCEKKIDQNAKQKLAFEAIMSTIDDNSLPQRLFFLDGPGGSGKTFLYKTLLSTIRGNNGIALPVASTGIAANLLKGGRTYHSQFKLPVPLLDTSTSSMRMTSDDAKQIREANVIIYDEATMAPKDALRCINNLLKEIMQNEKPLGEFSAWLLKLGNGELTNDLGLDSDTFEIPSERVCNGDLVKKIYGDKLLPSDFEQYTDKAILCPRNVDVDDINNRVLDILEGDSITYFSSDSIDDATPEDNESYPPEFLNSLNPSGMPLHKLKLKVGAIIMLLRNLNTKRGLCNGTRLVVTKLLPNLIIAKVRTCTAVDQSVFIPRVYLAPIHSEIPFILRRGQFPVKLAFAMTINKSQGQTLEMVGIYLPEPVFSHGTADVDGTISSVSIEVLEVEGTVSIVLRVVIPVEHLKLNG
ncbi:hypothetical protein LAZ67_22000600 [Cordylochernes scorpioides]|uniref:ATP-dependent DNA helicase n=1 Tax=Cordylochernes scorpioides TaxID=51811 RepID=A0ABY6LQ50_9ARAC|nr:hypothetical protein LAZ67_22000600 [Cordylochernes scorpioides]